MKSLSILVAILALTTFLAGMALAAPDTYIGDSAIYSTLDTGSGRPKPHVLLLIDTSQATLNRASGVAYELDTAVLDPDTGEPVTYVGSYRPWDIYAANNQGDFSTLVVANDSVTLEGVTCNTAVVKSTLLTSGTYSGSGSSAYPNLKAGGACDVGPKGATYAIGNYLNYLNLAGQTSTTVVQHTYDCEIGNKQGNKIVYSTVADGCVGTFAPIANIAANDASTEPQTGTAWSSFWTQQSEGCNPTNAACKITSIPAPLTVAATIASWLITDSYSFSATFIGGSQRKIIYKALEQVVGGSRNAVNFTAMTYNPNNQGGHLIWPAADSAGAASDDLSVDANFTTFKSKLPGQYADDTLFGAQLIAGATNRPQSEALFDAGYYLGAKYPTSGTIAADAFFPLPNGTFSRENISTSMAGKYKDGNANICGYNHIILITNGLSWGDGNPSLYPLVDADGDERGNEGVYGGGSHFLDDVAAYLYKQEGMVTHTVLAFQSSDPLVQRAANVGGGKYYNVYDANSLAKALTKLLASIVSETDTSFVAPVVPASSTNRTISSNRVYLGLFKPQVNRPWLGNLKKYGVGSDLTLLDRSDVAATDQYGDFLPNSKSFWGVDGADKIMSIEGPLPLAVGATEGDGGNVAAGGVGGTLIVDLQAGLAASPAKQAWETRKIYTWPAGSASTTLTHADNRFSPSNAKITEVTLDVPLADKDKLINFVAGSDGYDDNKDLNSTEIRDWVLGDILHSKPLIFSYSTYTEAEEASCPPSRYGLADDAGVYNRSMVYVGSNDGMFHAFWDCDGSEAWAFIPDNVLPKLKYLRESEHTYFADSSPTAYVHDVNNNNIIEPTQGDKAILIFGQGRGGGRNTLDAAGSRGAYYALDVSVPKEPKLLWRIDSNTTDFGELGQTWSPPRLAKIKDGVDGNGDGVRKVVAFVGAGYDNNEDLRYGNKMLFPDTTDATTDTSLLSSDSWLANSAGTSSPFNPRGRGVYAIEVAKLSKNYGACTGTDKYCPDFTTSGSKVWSFVHAVGNSMDYSIPSDLTILDMDGDTFQDRVYVGDTGGRLWRFDIGSTSTTDWSTSARIIFKSNKDGETNTGRKLFYRPTIALVKGIPTLYFGTGDRNHPLNTAVTDRLFAVKDKGQTTVDNINIDNLEDFTTNELQSVDTDADEAKIILDRLDTKHGWYVDLNQNAGEKVLASALVFSKQAFYTTYTPLPVDQLDDCQIGNLGTSRVYQLDYATAEAVQNYDTLNDVAGSTLETSLRAHGGDGIALRRTDRVREIGVGIPSGIVTLIDASGKVTLMISSSNRVGTYQAPDAKMMTPLYWMKY